MKGIRVLGKGGFGCVVKPVVACKPGSGSVSGARFPPGTEFVSKLRRNVDGDADADGDAIAAEFVQGELMSAVDSEHAFSVGVRGWCAAQFENDDEAAAYASACDHALGRDQVIYEDGGATVHAVLNARPLLPHTVLTVLRSFTNLLAGLVVMNQPPGIVHMDIKCDNIVVDLATGKARFIDYGFLRPHSDIVDLTAPTTITRAYWVWPPEWDYLGARLRKYANSVPVDAATRALAVGTTPKPGKSKYAAANKMLTEWGYGFAVTQQAALLATAKAVETEYPLAAATSLEAICAQFTRAFANKLDIFGTGTAVAQVAYVGAALLPERLKLPLRRWIGRATDPVPYARFTPEEALAAYQHMWTEFDTSSTALGGRTPRRKKSKTPTRRQRSMNSKTPKRQRRRTSKITPTAPVRSRGSCA
jgi:hypothetical protein